MTPDQIASLLQAGAVGVVAIVAIVAIVRITRYRNRDD